MKPGLHFAVMLALCPALGCMLLIREPQAYREDVVELVADGEEQIQACYEQALAQRQQAVELTEREAQGPYADIGPAVKQQVGHEQGLVVVKFRVAAKTGQLADARVDAQQTTAPAPAVACVLASLDGLVLPEPDHRDAEVTLAWQLKVGKPKAEPAPSAPASETSAEVEQRALE